MFRPSNPSDQYLTMLELKDWERQRDSKKDDFPFIQLSKEELKLLNAARHDWVEVTDKNRNSAIRLRDLVFIRILSPENKENIEVCEIRDRGREYLMYFQGIKAQKRVESIRYWITTGIAILALALAIFSLILQYEDKWKAQKLELTEPQYTEGAITGEDCLPSIPVDDEAN